jgi:transcriptional regulator with XRE-family HTH domain
VSLSKTGPDLKRGRRGKEVAVEKERRLAPVDSAAWALRQRREQRGLSARELSLRAGLSESYCGKYESGRIECSLRNFAKIARVLDLTAQEIYFIVVQTGRHDPDPELLSHPLDSVDA